VRTAVITASSVSRRVALYGISEWRLKCDPNELFLSFEGHYRLLYVYLGPSPGPNSCGDRFGSNRPVSFKLSNISSAFKMAWSMLKYL